MLLGIDTVVTEMQVKLFSSICRYHNSKLKKN